MSDGTQNQDLASLIDKLGQEGAISTTQVDILQRLVAEVSDLIRRQSSQRKVIVRTAVPLTPEERSRGWKTWWLGVSASAGGWSLRRTPRSWEGSGCEWVTESSTVACAAGWRHCADG